MRLLSVTSLLLAKFLFAFSIVLTAAAPSAAQETEERSALIEFVENQLSSDNRKIRLNGINGTLSSNVSMDSITIADEDGVWLTITEPRLIWSRTALLRGRLEIEKLTAKSIEMPRGPKPDESAPAPEAGGFALPELPVSINLEELNVPLIAFGEPVFGLKSEMSIEGAIKLDEGALTTNLKIARLDGPGGNLDLDVTYDGGANTLALMAALSEPKDGIIANLINLDGKPPVSLVIEGDAPIDNLDVTLAFDVDAKRILNGNLNLDSVDKGLGLNANLGGPLSSILPPDYRDILGDVSRLSANATLADGGETQIDNFSLDSGAIKLSADARLLADGFLSALNVTARLADPAGTPIELPGAQSATSFADAEFNITYDAEAKSGFEQTLALRDLKTTDISVGAVTLNTIGTVRNLQDAATRGLTFKTEGRVSSINAKDEAMAKAIGNSISLMGMGDWQTGKPLQFSEFDIEGKDYSVRTTGALTTTLFDGQIGLEAADLNSFSALAERPLSGSLGLVATGQIKPLSGAFDLDFNGVGNGLRTGTEALDKLLGGSSKLSGKIARGEKGIEFDRFRVLNNQTDILLDGRYASDLADLDARIDLRDIADLSDAGSGAVALTASVDGMQFPYDAVIKVDMPRGKLADKQVENLAATFIGKLAPEEVSGVLKGEGSIDGAPISLDGNVKRDTQEIDVSDFLAVIGGARVALDLTRQNDSGLMDGTASIDATDVSSLAALALQEASGGVNAIVTLSADNDGQAANVSAKAADLQVAENRIGSADITADIKTLLKDPKINADISAADMLVSGVAIRTLNGDIATNGNEIDFDVDAALAQENAKVRTNGRVITEGDTISVSLDALNLNSNIGDAALAAPTKIVVRDGTASLSDAQLNIAGGSVRVSGTAGSALNLNADINQLPLNIANAFNPALGLGGTISGGVSVRGEASKPRVEFTIDGNNVTARQLAEAQISPLSIGARGTFDETQTVQLTALTISNAQNIAVQGSGRIPLSGGGLNFTADGTAPLQIAERFLAARGARVSGTARFNVTAGGSIQNPQLNGLLSIASGTFTDPLSNLKLTDIGLLAGLTGDTVTVQKLNARLASGGSISGSGTVGLTGNLPANLSIALNSSRYSDGQTFTTTVDGKLAVTGSLLRDPLLSGQINLGQTEITIPETFGGDIELLDVTHVKPDTPTQRTLNRIEKATPMPKPSSRPSILQLDLRIVAPARIFVRGRGLDAELGGTVTIKGPSTNVRPSGRFELRRGRLSVLGQRFDLDEGTVTLTGDLDPRLRFVARTQSGDTTAYITLSGRASDLDVSFSSTPELPQDEVLAIIIFGKGLSNLSPTQIARLASIAIELTGGNSPGLVDGIRGGLGLDDLDVVQDNDGNAAVKAGKYISDNVYLGVQAGQDTEATINLDITDSLTARGAVNSNGETSLGVFFEKDY